MSEWKKCSIKDVCIGIYDGPHATPPVSNSGGIFLGISNITSDGHLDLSSIKFINNEDMPKWTKRVTPQKDDIVFSYEATLNLYAIIPEGFYGCLGRRMALIRTDRTKVDNKFIFYYFFSKKWRDIIAERTITGSTVDRIPIATFPTFPIELPPIETQRRISTILSRYDSLIENYQKQIKLLEEAAQRLYKEWFIDLHFPGHENTNIVDGVPEGWEDTNVNGIVTFHRGYDLTHSEMIDGKYPVIGSTSIIGTHKDYKIKGPGIVTGRSGSLGKFQLIQSDFWPHNTTLYISDFKGHDVYYIYCMLNRLDFASLNNGGAIPTLNRNVLSNISVLEPDCKIQKEFTKIVTPMFVKNENISSQLRLLTEARDRLLPKLMSGEIEV